MLDVCLHRLFRDEEPFGDITVAISADPELLREGKLIEVMPKWQFSIFHLWIVHMANHYMTRPVRVFKQFTTQIAPKLFPKLPT
jgi:hypothetical protein